VNRATVFLGIASLMYLVAWFLPVIDGGTTLTKGGLPGWEALNVALSPIWDRNSADTWWGSVLAVLSGLTNAWFLFSVAALKGRPATSNRVLFWGAILAVLINAQWFVLVDPRSDLRIGYYLWFTSFAVLAAAVQWTPRILTGSGGPQIGADR
jgi:hypothetical protein